MFYLSLGLILPLSVAVHDPQGLDNHHLLGFSVSAVPVGQEVHQVVGAHDFVVGGPLLPSSVGVDSLGLAGVVQDVALNGFALRHAGSDEGSELD